MRLRGERVGPIAKQWEGEVVLAKYEMLRVTVVNDDP
jgi:hypothetical protein